MPITLVGTDSRSGTENFAFDWSFTALENDLVVVFCACGTTGSQPYAYVQDWQYGREGTYFDDIYVQSYEGKVRLTAAGKVMGNPPDTYCNIYVQDSTGTPYGRAHAYCFRSINTTDPLDQGAVLYTPASTGTPNSPSITPTVNDCVILVAAGSAVYDTTPGTITNYATPINYSTASVSYSFSTTYRILSGGGGSAEDPGAWSSWSSGDWCSITMAIRPLVGYPFGYHEGGVGFVNPHSGGQGHKVFRGWQKSLSGLLLPPSPLESLRYG